MINEQSFYLGERPHYGHAIEAIAEEGFRILMFPALSNNLKAVQNVPFTQENFERIGRRDVEVLWDAVEENVISYQKKEPNLPFVQAYNTLVSLKAGSGSISAMARRDYWFVGDKPIEYTPVSPEPQ